jgi:DNA-binding NtrC family response regulator
MKTTRMGPGTGAMGTDVGVTATQPVLIRVTTGRERGLEKRFEGGTLSIGSSPDADIVLTDGTVSRFHAELALLPHGVRVKDLGSTNGTFVGDARIEGIVVGVGTEVGLGRARIEIVAADVPAPELPSELMRFGKLVGAGVAMRRVFGQLDQAASVRTPVWVFGETGTGKTSVAHALHQASPRAEAPFVVLDLDSSAQPEALMDATRAAAGGTLVLERLDETTGRLQDALVQILVAHERQDRGVRFVATSTREPRAAVEARLLRREIFFHLGAAIRIALVPLRERLEDLPRLVEALASDMGYPGVRLSNAELSALRGQSLLGNVRELRRTIEATLVRAHAPRVSESILPAVDDSALARMPFKDAKGKLMDAFEHHYVEQLLDRANGNVSRAADEAGIDRNYFAQLAKKHGLR